MSLLLRSVSQWFSFTGCLVVLAFGGAPLAAAQAPPDAEAEATEAAMIDAATQAVEQWLPLVDADSFGTAYDAIGPPVQEHMSRKGWIAALQDMRQHIDAPSARKQTIAQYRTTVEEIGGGPFVAFLYEGDYDLGTFSESILVRQDSSRWTVVAYQVTPDMNLLREHDELSFDMIDYAIERDTTR